MRCPSACRWSTSTPSESAADLHTLLHVAGQTGPYVLAAHSYGGLVARYYANRYPTEVAGMVLIDSFSPELRDAIGPKLWPSWIVWNTAPKEIVDDYPDYEQVDFDAALDEVVAHKAIRPMPLSPTRSTASSLAAASCRRGSRPLRPCRAAH